MNVRALTGGITSSVHTLDVVDRRGTRHRLVLRRYLDTGDTDDARELSAAVEREGATLLALEASTLPAPRLVATDPTGGRAGSPALLMTRLPGRMLLTPSDPHRWRGRLAAALPQVHAVPTTAAPEATLMPDPARVEPPAWARDAALWRHAIGIARQAPTAFSRCFAHGDYQHFNLLWSRERLSGIVDWTLRGHRHARARRGSLPAQPRDPVGRRSGRRLPPRYEAESGRRSDPYWELRSALAFLPGWGHFIQLQAGRRLRVDIAGMNGRVEDLVAGITRRL